MTAEWRRTEIPMIDRPARRVIATQCLGPCRLSRAACDAQLHTTNQPCCWICNHDD